MKKLHSVCQCILGAGLLMMNFQVVAQHSVDLEKVKDFKIKKTIEVSGGISANTIASLGQQIDGRDPFTYYILGNLNIKLGGLVTLPFSFNLTNIGHGFNYPTPAQRLSISPKYKWITAHVGDISMNFSPYTLNGYQVRGVGVDLDPKGKFTFSGIYGRLQKAVEYDSVNQVVPAAYSRYGYGAKIQFRQKKYTLGLIAFTAKDRVNSLVNKPDSIGIFPQQNLVLSGTVAYFQNKNIELSLEYAANSLTRDRRDTTSTTTSSNIFKGLMDAGNATSFYNAFKSNLKYKFGNSMLGVGYERIDPGYQTLGSYYFNNDLENITFDISQPFLKGKATVTANLGFQKDNLDGKKANSTKRAVSSFNLNYTPSAKLYINGSYSNFSTYMRVNPLFQVINQTQFQDPNLQDFSQVSQNANVNLNYTLKKSSKAMQSVNVNLGFLDASDRQGGVVKFGNGSQFYNVSTSYTLSLVPQAASITTAFNFSYNTIGKNNYATMGPTLSVNSKLFKTITCRLVTSYNKTSNDGAKENSVFNTRLGFNYAYGKKHTLALDFMNQLRDVRDRGKTNDLVATFGYNYTF